MPGPCPQSGTGLIADAAAPHRPAPRARRAESPPPSSSAACTLSDLLFLVSSSGGGTWPQACPETTPIGCNRTVPPCGAGLVPNPYPPRYECMAFSTSVLGAAWLNRGGSFDIGARLVGRERNGRTAWMGRTRPAAPGA